MAEIIMKFTNRELDMLYTGMVLLKDNKFMYNCNNFKKKEIDELKEKVRKQYWDEKEFGICLLNDKDFDK